MNQTASPYLVTNSTGKIRLLKALADNRCLLSITISNLKITLTSVILDVDHDFIILDELIPHTANLTFHPDTAFSVLTKFKGIPIRFSSMVVSIGQSSDGVTYYTCGLPDTLNYHQKRQSYRLPSHGANWPSIMINSLQADLSDESDDPTLENASGDPLQNRVPQGKAPLLEKKVDGKVELAEEQSQCSISGKIVDISIGGALAQFDRLPEWAQCKGTITCTIELTNGPILCSRVQVRHVQKSDAGRSNRRVYKVGLKFLSLNEINKKQLQQWIVNSERKKLRQ